MSDDADDTPTRAPGLRSLARGWAADANRRRRSRARVRRARWRANVEFFLADLGRALACWPPCALACWLGAAALDLSPRSIALAVAAAPAAFAGRVVSELRPFESLRAWREAQST